MGAKWGAIAVSAESGGVHIRAREGCRRSRTASEHGMRMRRVLGDDLEDIPMLHDLPLVIEPEDVHARSIRFPRPGRMDVHDHIR